MVPSASEADRLGVGPGNIFFPSAQILPRCSVSPLGTFLNSRVSMTVHISCNSIFHEDHHSHLAKQRATYHIYFYAGSGSCQLKYWLYFLFPAFENSAPAWLQWAKDRSEAEFAHQSYTLQRPQSLTGFKEHTWLACQGQMAQRAVKVSLGGEDTPG